MTAPLMDASVVPLYQPSSSARSLGFAGRAADRFDLGEVGFGLAAPAQLDEQHALISGKRAGGWG